MEIVKTATSFLPFWDTYFENLGLRLTYISRQRFVKLSLIFVFITIPVLSTGFVFFFLG